MLATSVEERTGEPTLPLDDAPVERPASALATSSLVAGILSPLLVCACGLSTISSVVAIVCGHMAIARIKNSNGSVIGRDRAICGVVLGYAFLLISLITMPFMWSFVSGFRDAAQQASSTDYSNRENATARTRFRRAESNIRSDMHGTVHGNTPLATELAQEFSSDMKTLREVLFTGSDEPGVSLTHGEFITHCELHADRCAFLVHVPGYRNFDDDAKEALEDLAWRVAQRTVQNELELGDKLAIGLKGTLLYGSVRTGKVAVADEADEAPYDEVEEDALLAFFVPDSPPTRDSVLEGTEYDRVAMQPLPPLLPSENGREKTPPAAQVHSDQSNEPEKGGVTIRAKPSEPVVAAPRSHSEEPLDISVASDNQVNSQDRTDRSEHLVQEFPDLGWAVTALDFSPNGKWLVAGKMDRALLVFDIFSGDTVASHKDLGQFGSITAVSFVNGGTQLLVGGSTGAIEVWNVGSAGELEPSVSLTGHQGAVRCFAARENFTFVVSGADDKRLQWQPTAPNGAIRVNDLLERKVLATFLPATGTNSLATDGRQLVNIDLKKATAITSQQLSRGIAHAVAFSPDGDFIALSTGSDVEVRDTTTGKQLHQLKAKSIQWSLQFTPDGSRLLSGGRGKVSVWDWQSDSLESVVSLGDVLYVKTMAISADGRYLAAIPSSAGQTLKVFRLKH